MVRVDGFKPYNQEQTMLLPLSLDEFIPAGHKARIISAVVDRLDLSRLYNTYCTTVGQDAYDPRMLVKVLFSGWDTTPRVPRKDLKLGSFPSDPYRQSAHFLLVSQPDSLSFQIHDDTVFPHPQFEVWGALQLLQVGQGVATDSFDGCNDPQNYLAR
ncbi:MAG: hypothetical protein RQM90_01250 [Methanoculleus sp.]|jgi:hypothetical protein